MGNKSNKMQVPRLTKVGAVATLCVSITATVLWIAAIAYFKLWDSNKKTYYDLWSWVCTHQSTFKGEGIDMTPLCLEMVSFHLPPLCSCRNS